MWDFYLVLFSHYFYDSLDPSMLKRLFYTLLLLFLMADTTYSFFQHRAMSLDGDMAFLLVPAPTVQPIHDSPLGLRAIMNDEYYLNPNRYFCHVLYREWMTKVPLLLQKLVSPIESVYLAGAIGKTLIQLLLLSTISYLVAFKHEKIRLLLISAVLIAPFFQANGYVHYMGIIDRSTTYTFFYALPTALLLLYLIPFIREFYFKVSSIPHKYVYFYSIPFSLVVSLNGALNPGIALIFSAMVFITFCIKHLKFSNQIMGCIRAIPKSYWAYLLPLSLFSLYSLYLGSYNDLSIVQHIPLIERYSKLPQGLFNLLTGKPGFLFLFVMLALNAGFIYRKFNNSEGTLILKTFKWILIFAGIYILLLPLGGYRDYRFYVIRYDTFLPITLALIFLYARSSIFLLQQISSIQKRWYIPLLVVMALIYTNADRANFDTNSCEHLALKTISNSEEDIVVLHSDCSVLSWELIEDPSETELNARLLQMWNITDKKKLYYHKLN